MASVDSIALEPMAENHGGNIWSVGRKKGRREKKKERRKVKILIFPSRTDSTLSPVS